MRQHPHLLFKAIAIGSVCAAAAGVLLAWLLAWKFSPEAALSWATWAAGRVMHAPEAAGEVGRNLMEIGWVGLAALACALLSLRALAEFLSLLDNPADSRDGAMAIDVRSEARAGCRFEGRLMLDDPPTEDFYHVRLVCRRIPRGANQHAFHEERIVRATRGADGWELTFSFDIPADAPPTAVFGVQYAWRLEASPKGRWFSLPSIIDVAVAPATAPALRALEATESPEQRADLDEMAEAHRILTRGRELEPHERGQLRRLSPEDRAIAKKVFALPATFLKWALILIAGYFLLMVLDHLLLAGAISLFGRSW